MRKERSRTMLKKLLVCLLVVTLMLTPFAGMVSASGTAVNPPADMVGKYINIGKYNNVDVTYKVWGTRDVDSDGTAELFVAPEQLLFPMAYNTTSVANWEYSSLRAFLNNDETGFLAGFTADEKSIIAQVTQNTLFGQESGASGGNCYFNNISASTSNWCVANATSFNAAFKNTN